MRWDAILHPKGKSANEIVNSSCCFVFGGVWKRVYLFWTDTAIAIAIR